MKNVFSVAVLLMLNKALRIVFSRMTIKSVGNEVFFSKASGFNEITKEYKIFNSGGFKIKKIIIEKISVGQKHEEISNWEKIQYELIGGDDETLGFFGDYQSVKSALRNEKLHEHFEFSVKYCARSPKKEIIRETTYFVVIGEDGRENQDPARRGAAIIYNVFFNCEKINKWPLNSFDAARRMLSVPKTMRLQLRKICLNFMVWVCTGVALALANLGKLKELSSVVNFLDVKLAVYNFGGFILMLVILFGALIYTKSSLKKDGRIAIEESFQTIESVFQAWVDVVINFGSISLLCGVAALIQGFYLNSLGYFGSGVGLYLVSGLSCFVLSKNKFD